MSDHPQPVRGEVFRYEGLSVEGTTLRAHYSLDGQDFEEVVTFEETAPLETPAVRAVAELWYLVAGLSYYKTRAPKTIDLGDTPLGERTAQFFHACFIEGLGEFCFRNNLRLDDVTIRGGASLVAVNHVADPSRVLTPFGGGIDSVVTVTGLNPALDQALFVMSPASGLFAPLEATAAVTGLPVVRATRSLDPKLFDREADVFRGHVPVTAMVTLLATVAALGTGRGAVVMSNEHSASVPNFLWDNLAVNHQWSKSWAGEILLAEALAERIGSSFVVASFLRNRSEVWVAQQFAQQSNYLPVFRSCNRAFAQQVEGRAATWCGECDKCLFINLVLAPFIGRTLLREIFRAEPLADPARHEQLRSLVGVGLDHKPFECVGDPDESAAALMHVANSPEWQDAPFLQELSEQVRPTRSFAELLEPQGPSRVPSHWLR